MLAGQVGVSGHLTIHDNAVIYAQSGIGDDVPAGSVIAARPRSMRDEWLRAITAFQKLPEILKTVRQLENRSSLRESRKHGRADERLDITQVPPLAYSNEEFLDSPDARPLRILCEYLYPLSHFRKRRLATRSCSSVRRGLMEDGPAGTLLSKTRASWPRRITAWSDNFR